MILSIYFAAKDLHVNQHFASFYILCDLKSVSQQKYLISFKETARIFGFRSCCLFYLAYTTSLVFHCAITTRDFARNSLPVFCWHFYHFRYYFSECLYDICFQCQIFSSFKLLPPLYTWTHKQLAGHVHTCNSWCETFFYFKKLYHALFLFQMQQKFKFTFTVLSFTVIAYIYLYDQNQQTLSLPFLFKPNT